MYNPRRLLLVTLLLALAGCGFRLAGTGNLPPALESIHLVTSNFETAQTRVLRERLERAGARVSLEPSEGAVRLSVTLKQLPDRRLATGASSGKKVNRLSRALDFSVRDADGVVLAPSKTLTQHKDIVLDDDNLLASDVERDSVIEELEASLFNLLVHQLRRLQI